LFNAGIASPGPVVFKLPVSVCCGCSRGRHIANYIRNANRVRVRYDYN